MAISEEIRRTLLRYQKNEITEHHIYRRLAARMPSGDNRKVLTGIAADELRHYEQWRRYTQQDVRPGGVKIAAYVLIARLLGLTFAVKLMENGEESAQDNYGALRGTIPEADAIAQEENQHENALLQLLDEERLRYTGSMVLGLNDALVELTGALAGFTFALQDTRLIALTGSITGFAAALSMGASEYLSTKSEETSKDPLKASLYTGAAYVVTVVLLILPYLLLSDFRVCLALTLATAVAIIAVFNYYISVARSQPFRRRFLEMAGLSLGVAALSFGVGYLMRTFMGVEV
jgi:VIT1/CCC1 family predicted Fe2+/Mn2+ transporter